MEWVYSKPRNPHGCVTGELEAGCAVNRDARLTETVTISKFHDNLMACCKFFVVFPPGRSLLLRRGCVAVSVTLMCCAQTTKSIIMRPSHDCSTAILAFPYQMRTRYLEGIPIIEGVKCWECVFSQLRGGLWRIRSYKSSGVMSAAAELLLSLWICYCFLPFVRDVMRRSKSARRWRVYVVLIPSCARCKLSALLY